MNLLFVTVEVERSHKANGADGSRIRTRHWPRSRRFRWIVLATAGLLCACVTTLVGWLVSGGDSLLPGGVPDWLPMSATSAAASDRLAQLQIASVPDSANVVIDGRSRGKTPLSVAVASGQHTLLLTNPDAIDDQRQLTVAGDMDVSVSMMLRRPDALQLKPAYPGANISAASFLADGRLALLMAVPGETGNPANRRLAEAWIFDPPTRSLVPFMAAGPKDWTGASGRGEVWQLRQSPRT